MADTGSTTAETRTIEVATAARAPADRGIGLIVVGLLVTLGPLAFDLGGTESPPPDAGDESDGAGDSDANGDGTSETEENDDAESIRGAIGEVISGDDNHERATGDEGLKECFVD